MPRLLITSSLSVLMNTGCAGPQPDPAADAETIRHINQAYIALHPRGDVDELMTLYEPDVVLLPPAEAPVVGIEAVRAYWAAFFDDWEVLEASSTLEEIIVAGDWAYGRGSYTETFREKASGATIVDSGKFSGMWRRQADGTWKIARDMWNAGASSDSNAPD